MQKFLYIIVAFFIIIGLGVYLYGNYIKSKQTYNTDLKGINCTLPEYVDTDDCKAMHNNYVFY